MKTTSYNQTGIKIVIMTFLLFGLQITVLYSGNSFGGYQGQGLSLPCATCTYNSSENNNEVSPGALISLEPTSPAEATFDEETSDAELNLAPITPKEVYFDDEPESISTFALENLAPVNPKEADFD